jgi:hypothetical protein
LGKLSTRPRLDQGADERVFLLKIVIGLAIALALRVVLRVEIAG